MTDADLPEVSSHSEIITLYAEDASVMVRRTTGRVRIETVTSVVEEDLLQPLTSETTEVTHVACGRFVTEAPPVRQEGDLLVVPVLEERLVVERRLYLKEELHIRTVRTTADHRETVSLRKQDVRIVRAPDAAPMAAPGADTNSNHVRIPSMTNETIVAIYDSRDAADAAVADLHKANVPSDAISQHRADDAGGGTGTAMGGDSSAGAGVGGLGSSGMGAGLAGAGSSAGGGMGLAAGGLASPSGAPQPGFWSTVFGGDPGSDSAVYDRSMASGASVVTVKVPAEHVDSVSAILERHNPVDIDERGASLDTATGMTGSDSSAHIATTGVASSMATGEGTTRTTGAGMGMSGSTAASTAAGAGSGTGVGKGRDDVIQLAEEQIAVGKRAVNRGTTRVRRYVVETPVEESVNLREETVRVERRPVTDGRPVQDADFSDKVVEMTESAEEAVVSKTARVVEEVGIHKEVRDRTETVRDTVRRDEVEIEQPGQTRDTGSKPTGRA